MPRRLRRSSRARRLAGVAVAVAAMGSSAVIGSSDGTAFSARPSRFVSVWVPYWDTTSGSSSYGDAGDASIYSEVSPFFYQAQGGAGAVNVIGSTSRLTASVNLARARGLHVIPTVTDGTGKLGMQAIMADPSLRAAHIANLVNIAVANNYDGIDLDYEVFAFTDGSSTWAATKPLWIAFIQQLSAALHANGKLLAVTVPPVWHTGVNKDYWVYAQPDIAASVDELRLMVYDWSPGTPSATAPIQWVRDVVAYSSSVFGGQVAKLQLGVPAYGRHWRRPDVPGTACPDGSTTTNSVTTKAAPALAASIGVAPTRDASTGEMTFTWTEQVTGVHTSSSVVAPTFDPPDELSPTVQAGDGASGAPALRLGPPPVQVTCTIRHTVFYPDAASIAGKAKVALDAGWGGTIIWAAGYESSDVYDALAALS